MKNPLFKFAVVGCAIASLALRAVAFDSVLIANHDVSTDSVSLETLKGIYTAKTAYWPDGQAIVIGVVSDKTDAALKGVSGMDPNQFKTFWQRLAFSGRGKQPQKADDVTALVALIASTKGAIALVPAGTELKGVKQLELK